MRPSPALLSRGKRWHAAIGRPVVLAAITREGEEAELMREWGSIQGQRPFLIVVPRHPQRFDEVEALLVASGLRVARRRTWGETPSVEALKVDAWLGDSLGEMPQYYASSDVALLGGSFMALGGHNLIEAAACGCPLVMGPSTFNFSEAAALSLAAGASLQVADMDAGIVEVQRLLESPERLAALSRAALSFAAQHRGAAARMAQRIVPLMRG